MRTLVDALREELSRAIAQGKGDGAAAAMLRRQIRAFEMAAVNASQNETYYAGTVPTVPPAKRKKPEQT